MLSLVDERLTPKVLDHYLHHDLGMLPLLWWGIFCSFTHLRIPRSPPQFNQFIVLPRTLHKILSQSVRNFLSNVDHKQTNRQTKATKNITSFAKEVMDLLLWKDSTILLKASFLELVITWISHNVPMFVLRTLCMWAIHEKMCACNHIDHLSLVMTHYIFLQKTHLWILQTKHHFIVLLNF